MESILIITVLVLLGLVVWVSLLHRSCDENEKEIKELRHQVALLVEQDVELMKQVSKSADVLVTVVKKLNNKP